MRFGVLRALFLFGLLAVTACSIDFNEAVPCEVDDHCPEGFSCDQTVRRCVSGAVSEGTGGGTRDLGQEDTQVTDMGGTDTGGTDSGGDVPDGLDGGETDATTDADTGGTDTGGTDTGGTDTGGSDAGGDGATCTPALEICNGRDEDCDNVADNGVNCGTCPTGFGTMALVVRDGGAAFCIDVYEASREDATIDSVGTSANIVAHSNGGVLPWSNLGLIGARTACQGAGKRLCSDTEWQNACGGINQLIFPYSADTYNATACNGLDAGEGRAGPAGARLLCEGTDGALDMSGNLSEWIEGGKAHGGSFNSAEVQLRCDQPGTEPDLSAPGPSVGFRCCADAVAPTE